MCQTGTFSGLFGMNYYQPKSLKVFLGRTAEQAKIKEFIARDDAGILVVYGRRRAGKTELIQHVFADRRLLKFEGIEGKDEAFQLAHVLRELGKYTKDSKIQHIPCSTWTEVFEVISSYVKRGACTLYFEELQWLANYRESFVSELKHAWDNHFRYNPKLKLILCGSSPSFFHSKVLRSKALYNRSMVELRVDRFSITEAKAFYKPVTAKDLFDAYLTVGGIPVYLTEIKGRDSVYAKMAKASCVPGAFF